MMPIELPQHLETIAEVAAAFTGFAGLVSVLGSSNLDPKVRFWRVQLMIITSLAAMFGALTPPTIVLLAVQEGALWRLSSFVLLVLMSGQLVFVYRSMPIEHATGPLRMFYSPLASILTIGSLVLQGCLISIAAGCNLDVAPAVYVIALVFLLLASAFHFLRLVKGSQPNVAT
jgi:hypothetical protein